MWDLTLPGYKYLGPGNKLDKGLPNNHNDLVAYFHDIGYGEIEFRGKNPYLKWSKDDARAFSLFVSGGLRGTDVDRSKADYGGGLGKGYFGLKKLAYDIGLIGSADAGELVLKEMGAAHAVARYGKNLGQDEATPLMKEYMKRLREVNVPIVGEKRERTTGTSDISSIEPKDPQSKKLRGGEATREVEVNPAGDIDMADVEMGTGGVSAMSASSAGSNTLAGKANQAQHTTPVSNFQYAFEGIPRQFTTVLPWHRRRASATVPIEGTGGSAVPIIYIRMNSIYDIIKSDGTTFSADPSPTADTVDSSGTPVIEKPYWRDYWADFWEYWTVLECRWKCSFWSSTEAIDRGWNVFYGYFGMQKLPTDDGAGTPRYLGFDDYERFKGLKRVTGLPKKTQDTSGVNDHEFSNMKVITGVWHPGEGEHEVAEDELTELWHRGDAVPKEQDLLALVFTRSQDSAAAGTLTVLYSIELEYVVQYKDQKAKFMFPLGTGARAITGFAKVST